MSHADYEALLLWAAVTFGPAIVFIVILLLMDDDDGKVSR